MISWLKRLVDEDREIWVQQERKRGGEPEKYLEQMLEKENETENSQQIAGLSPNHSFTEDNLEDDDDTSHIGESTRNSVASDHENDQPSPKRTKKSHRNR